MDQDRYSIDVVNAAIDVMEALLSKESTPIKPAEIAKRTGINRTRVFRILKTLEWRGYVNVDENNNYSLSLKVLQFAESVRTNPILQKAARPYLAELAHKTGDTVSLLVFYRDHALCLDSSQGHYRLQVAVPIGQILPLHVGVSPKILLANLPEQEREHLLRTITLTAFTPNTIVDREILRKVLDEILDKGYAVDEEDYEIGVCAVGAPVHDQNGTVVAGITITTPRSRFDPARKEELIRMVMQTAEQISNTLGWNGKFSNNPA